MLDHCNLDIIETVNRSLIANEFIKSYYLKSLIIYL
jgi:hypothetical protein